MLLSSLYFSVVVWYSRPLNSLLSVSVFDLDSSFFLSYKDFSHFGFSFATAIVTKAGLGSDVYVHNALINFLIQ